MSTVCPAIRGAGRRQRAPSRARMSWSPRDARPPGEKAEDACAARAAVRCRPRSRRSADRCRRRAGRPALSARSAARTAAAAASRIRSEGSRSHRAAARGARARRGPRARCWPAARRRNKSAAISERRPPRSSTVTVTPSRRLDDAADDRFRAGARPGAASPFPSPGDRCRRGSGRVRPRPGVPDSANCSTSGSSDRSSGSARKNPRKPRMAALNGRRARAPARAIPQTDVRAKRAATALSQRSSASLKSAMSGFSILRPPPRSPDPSGCAACRATSGP